ncbi:hypothetical protein OCAE111667_13880 [Occultella aeris]|uniref:Uncharacterized protein n=1 Tax=Occultella aeris TaxID=2761496 RepID=A0A7M4DJ01_9MICO|nr:hypothetical protein HALOF300_02104 [Occultella aeris]
MEAMLVWLDSRAIRFASALNWRLLASVSASVRSTLIATSRRGISCWYRYTSENPPCPIGYL